MKTITQQPVLDQQLALSAYLEALLEMPAEQPVPPVPPVPPVSPVSPTPVVTAPATAVEPPPDREAVVGGTGGVPDWAESRFQVLLFEVDKLTLAVPLIKLKGVVPNDQGLTPMPGHSPLFLGIAPYQGLQSKVIDTARFVLPQDRVAQLGDDASERCRHLVMIDDGRWALACSRIGNVVELERDGVKWRNANGRRLWLAGTVIERMCALLDVEQLGRELVAGLDG